MAARVNTQTSNYTIEPQDDGKLVLFNSSSAVTVTLPQPGHPDWLGVTFELCIANIGTGTLTVAPISSSIDGSGSLALTANQGVQVFNDGANYFTVRGIASGSGVSLETNGTPNGSQTLLNLEQGTNVAIADDGSGNITISVPGVLSNPMTDEGDLIIGGASGTPTRLAAGTSGDVLTSNGPGAEPSWQPGGSGGYVPTPPTSGSSTGTAGQYSILSGGAALAVCVSTNTWKMVPLNFFDTPSLIPGLAFWFRSDQLSGTSGTPVPTLIDLSPNQNAAISANGATFETNQINGEPALSFPGNSDGNYSLNNPFALLAATIFIVFDNSNTSSKSTFFSGNHGALAFWANGTTNCIGIDSDQVAQIAESSASLPSGWVQANVTYNSNGGEYAFRIAQTAAGSGTRTASINAGQTSIGYNGATDAEFVVLDVAELIVYNQVLSSSQITQVETYLNARYGL